MAARQTTMIKASMTAYSTAVGPSSRFRKSTVAFQNLRIGFSFLCNRVPVPAFPSGWFQPSLLKTLAAPCGQIIPLRSARGGADLLADRGEGRVGVLAERRDGREANHDDQGQHDRVLDSRRAVFTLQEINCRIPEL